MMIRPRIIIFLAVAVFLFSFTIMARAEEETAQAEEVPLIKLSPEELWNQPVTLDLRDMDVIEALKYLAAKGDLNIISSKNVSGRVSLSLKDIPLKDIFDLMLRTNGLAYVKQGEVYNVMTEAEYKALYGKNFYDIRQVKMLRLKYAIPEQAFAMLDALKSEIGRVLVDAESGNVLIMETPGKIAEMEASLEEFEKQNVVEVFTLMYSKAKEVEEILKTRLDVKKVGSITSDERNNQVIVQTLADRMEEIRRLIASLDAPTKQVVIDTKIIKVALSDQLDNSAEWEGILGLAKENGLTYLGSTPFSTIQAATATWQSRNSFYHSIGDDVGAFPFSGTTSSTSSSMPGVLGEAMHIGSFNSKMDYDAFFKLLNTMGTTRVLSNAKIVAVNNQEAKIHVGERQAYVTTTTSSGTSTSTIAEEVTFVDVGVQLSVTPTINDDGYITMKIKPEVSSVTSFMTTPTNNRIPIIDTSAAETTVLVKDGVTVVVGGMRKEEKIHSYEGTPILSKIPVVNMFFRAGYEKTVRTELLILMTPHIISGKVINIGDERAYGDKPGKEYQDYQTIAPEDKGLPPLGVPPEIQIKPYQQYMGLKDSDEKFLAKGQRHDSY